LQPATWALLMAQRQLLLRQPLFPCTTHSAGSSVVSSGLTLLGADV
jgi:hypothetical protein